jgi:hypothetical protein
MCVRGSGLETELGRGTANSERLSSSAATHTHVQADLACQLRNIVPWC